MTKKSFRRLLSVWFLAFAFFPLFILMGSTSFLFERSMNQELFQRLLLFEETFKVEWRDLQDRLLWTGRRHARFLARTRVMIPLNVQEILQPLVAERESFLHRVSVTKLDGTKLYETIPEAVAADTRIKIPEETALHNALIQRISAKKQLMEVTSHSGGFLMECYTYVSARVPVILREASFVNIQFLENLKGKSGLDGLLLNPQSMLIATTLPPALTKLFHVKKLRQTGEKGILSIHFQKKHFFARSTPIKISGQKEGRILLLASHEGVEQTLSKVRQLLALVTVILVIIIFFFARLASLNVTRPLGKLVAAMEKIQKGEFQAAEELREIEAPAPELEFLTLSFVIMAENLRKMTQQLEEKITALAQTNEELKNTQTQLIHTAKMGALGQLVAGIAHELNNPIGYTHSNITHLQEYLKKVKGMLQEYEKAEAGLSSSLQGALKQKKEQYEIHFILKDMDKLIQSCLEGTKRTKGIVEGLRNFSRLDEAELKEVDIHEGLEMTLQLLTGEFKNRVVVHKEYGKIPKIVCYPSQLNQVFMNLLTNASQAMEKTGTIWITTRTTGNQVVITIRDDGQGIKPEHLDKIFDPFFTTKEVGKGTGLGLSISYGIIQKHEGTITAQSIEGKGTTFTITLPMKKI